MSLFCFLFSFPCSRLSFVGVPLIFSYPVNDIPDWQPRILLGMVEARSVNVNNTHTHIINHSTHEFGTYNRVKFSPISVNSRIS